MLLHRSILVYLEDLHHLCSQIGRFLAHCYDYNGLNIDAMLEEIEGAWCVTNFAVAQVYQ